MRHAVATTTVIIAGMDAPLPSRFPGLVSYLSHVVLHGDDVLAPHPPHREKGLGMAGIPLAVDRGTQAA